jgi:hypothetical protein
VGVVLVERIARDVFATVDDQDAITGIGQFAGTGRAGEAGSDNQDICCVSHFSIDRAVFGRAKANRFATLAATRVTGTAKVPADIGAPVDMRAGFNLHEGRGHACIGSRRDYDTKRPVSPNPGRDKFHRMARGRED